MTQSFSTTWVRWRSARTLSARTRLLTPVVLGTLSLASLAHAQTAPDAQQQPMMPGAAAAPAAASTSDAPSAPNSLPGGSAAAAPAAPVAPSETTTTIITTTTTTTALPPTAAEGSQPPRTSKPTRTHEGFYLRLTSGPGLLTLNGHGPYGNASLTDVGAGGMISIGGAIVPGFVLAGTLQGTAMNAKFEGGPFENATVNYRGRTRDASDRSGAGFGMIGMLVDWYPEPKGGWHAGAATGVGAVILTNSADESDFGGVNFAGSLFGGYDWALGRNWSLGLQLVMSGGTRTKLMVEDDSAEHDARDTGYRLTPFSVGVQASLLYF